jgi:hypothetical protein
VPASAIAEAEGVLALPAGPIPDDDLGEVEQMDPEAERDLLRRMREA